MINLSRGTLGWGLKTADDLDEEIKIWALTFSDYKIPNEHLEALWRRARDLRITRFQNGLNAPDFTAELLAACWIGENGLKAELQRNEIRAKKFLTGNAESGCPRCFGIGMENIYSDDGKQIGSRPGCRHLELQPGEWLWKKREMNQECEEIND